MIVCVCNNVSDRKIRQAVDQGGAVRIRHQPVLAQRSHAVNRMQGTGWRAQVL